MKRLSAIIAAALIMLTVTGSVYAEPSETDQQNSLQQSSQTSAQDNSSMPEETSVEDNSTGESSTGESSTGESSTGESSTGESSTGESSTGEKSGEENSSEESKPVMKEYRLDKAGLNISMPDDILVLTRDMSEDDPVLAAYRKTKDKMLEQFEKTDTYMKASRKDFLFDVTITIVEDKNTREVGSLSSLNDKDLQSLIDTLLENPVYKGCSKATYNNTLFLSLNTEQESESARISGRQEYTILNGKRVIITFQSYDGTMDEEDNAFVERVMETAVFDGVEPVAETPSKEEPKLDKKMDVRWIYLIAASAVALLSLMIMIIAGMKYKRSKLLSEQEEEDEVEIDIDPKHTTTAVIYNREDENSEPEDIFSDTRMEKQGAARALSAEGHSEDAPAISQDESQTGSYPDASGQERPDAESLTVVELSEEIPPVVLENAADGITEINEEIQGSKIGVVPEEVGETDHDPGAGDVDFIEITDERSTEIGQPCADETEQQNPNEAPAEEPDVKDEAVSAFEKRFGKNRRDSEVADADSDNKKPGASDEKKISKFEKRFGRSDNRVKQERSSDKYGSKPTISEKNTHCRKESIDGVASVGAANAVGFAGSTAGVAAGSAAGVAGVAAETAAGAAAATAAAGIAVAAKESGRQPTEGAFSKLISRMKNRHAAPEDSVSGLIRDEKTGTDDGIKNTEHASAAVEAPKNESQDEIIDISSEVLSENPDSVAAEENSDMNMISHEPELIEATEEKPAAASGTQQNAKTQNIKDENTIEIDIRKSADGSLVIGAMKENDGQPVDIEIKDSADLKAEKRRELEDLGLQTGFSNELYDRRDAAVKDGFTVKAKQNERAAAFETGLRSDKTSGSEGEKKTTGNKDTAESARIAEADKGSSPERHADILNGTSEGIEEAGISAGSAIAVTAGAVTAAAAGTAAVAAVFGMAEESKGKKLRSEPTRPETEEEFLENAVVEEKAYPDTESLTISVGKSASEAKGPDESIKAKAPKTETEKKSRRKEFMFERDSGIIFEHAPKNRQTLQPLKHAFEVVPRLEDVKAEEYNRQYDEKRRSIPRNHAYAQRFNTQPPMRLDGINAGDDLDSGTVIPDPFADENEGKTEKSSTENKKDNNDNIIEFYKGYEEDDPFASDNNQSEEIRIKDHKRNKGSIGSRFKKSLGKLFSGEGPADEE